MGKAEAFKLPLPVGTDGGKDPPRVLPPHPDTLPEYVALTFSHIPLD